MRLIIDKNAFLKALTTVDKAIPSKSAIPVICNFKLELNEKGLEVTGTNSELTIRSTVPYMIGNKEVIREPGYGAILVNAHLLTEYIRQMGGETISFDVIDNVIAKIDDGKTSVKLNCFRAEEYPDIDLDPTGVSFDMACKTFYNMVEQTSFAASPRDSRPILTAVNLDARDGKLIATATDSARLSQKTVSLDDQDVRFRCNISARTLADISRMFENSEMVRVCISDQKALFDFDRTIVATRLTQGDYPVTQSIIPTRFNYYLDVNAQELLSAMSRLSLLSTEKDSAVKLSMREDEVELYVRSESSGSANERIDTFQFSGERFEVSFNPLFIIDAIKALKSEDVTLCFQGEMMSFVVRNSNDDSIIELVTPKKTY